MQTLVKIDEAIQCKRKREVVEKVQMIGKKARAAKLDTAALQSALDMVRAPGTFYWGGPIWSTSMIRTDRKLKLFLLTSAHISTSEVRIWYG